MLFNIIFLPLFGFLGACLFGRFIGVEGTKRVTTMFTFFSFLLSFSLFLNILKTGNTFILNIGQWICIDNLQVNWCFCFDSLTVAMLCVVTSISSFVHLYSTEYMEYDPHLTRFMGYLSLFTFFMIILVTFNISIQMFIGWESIGVVLEIFFFLLTKFFQEFFGLFLLYLLQLLIIVFDNI